MMSHGFPCARRLCHRPKLAFAEGVELLPLHLVPVLGRVLVDLARRLLEVLESLEPKRLVRVGLQRARVQLAHLRPEVRERVVLTLGRAVFTKR